MKSRPVPFSLNKSKKYFETHDPKSPHAKNEYSTSEPPIKELTSSFDDKLSAGLMSQAN